MDLLRETVGILRKYGIRPRKKLGQHFLVDERVLELILRALELSGVEEVLEIGAGIGTVTRALAERAKRVIAIEVDARLVRVLEDLLSPYGNVEIVRGDFLEIEVPGVDRVFSNVPYSISSPLLFKLLDEPGYEFAILTFQKEFVDRLLAEPGTREYGRLTVSLRLRARAEVLARISRRAFYPVPEVDSALVKIVPSRTHLPWGEVLEDFLRFAFSQRRKRAEKVVRSYLRRVGLGMDPAGVLREAGVDRDARIYELSPEQFSAIARAITCRVSS